MAVQSSVSLWNKRWFLWLVHCAALVMTAALLTGLYFNALPNVPQKADYPLLYASARSALLGGSVFRHFIYEPVFGDVLFLAPPASPFDAQASRLMENLNAPIVTLLAMPFATYGLRASYYLWCGAQLILALLVSWRLLARFELRHPLLKPASLLILTGFFPILANLLIGQLGLFLFVVLGLFILALDQGQWRRAGVWLGLALLLKLFVGLIFIALLVQRRWLVLSWGSLIWVLGMGAGLLIFGIDDHIRWLQVLHNYHAGALSWNAALKGVTERYFGEGLTVSIYPSPWLCWALRSAAYIGTAFCFIQLGRLQPRLTARVASLLAAAISLPLMLLLAPLGWIYYFPVLLLSALVCWHVLRDVPRARLARSLSILALMLSGIPQLLTAGNNMTWELWHRYRDDGFAMTQGTQQVYYATGPDFHWFVAPELYTLALILMACACMSGAYRLRSIQTGA